MILCLFQSTYHFHSVIIYEVKTFIMKKVIALLAINTLLIFNSCSKKEEIKEEENTYPITSPIVMDTIINKEYVAKIQSVKNIEVRAQEKGFLQKTYVDEGQYVHAGQVLFSIMPQIYQAEVLKSKAEVEQASIELQNASTLANNNIVSKNERAMAKAKLDVANAEMRLAQVHLSFTIIRAPFSGIINRLPLKIGSLVDEGDLLTSLSDNGDVYAYFNMSEPEYLNYQTHQNDRAHQNVNLIMANGDTFKNPGIVQTIEGEFDSETGNIAFRAKFPNPEKLLRNGETGKVQMNVPIRNAMIIPQKATYEIQDQTYVFVVDKKGNTKSRNIKIAYELPDIYVVSSGLQVGDQFLLEGVQKVKDDQKVKTKYKNPHQVLKTLKLNAN